MYRNGNILSFTLHQRLLLFNVINELFCVETEDDLLACIGGPIQKLLPHEWFICCIGQLMSEGISAIYTVSRNLPSRYLDITKSGNNIYNSYAIQEWRKTRQPVIADFEHPNANWAANVIAVAKEFEFKNVLAHGCPGFECRITSYFSFHRINQKLGSFHYSLAKLIAPHLHEALLRAKAHREAANDGKQRTQLGSPLTDRQVDILYWMQHGKTNWEISRILNTSVDNIKYHIRQINAKLGTNNRIASVIAAAPCLTHRERDASKRN